MAQLLLVLLVFFGNMTEAIAGFGSTMFAVIVGAHFYPLQTLIPSLVPLNLLLSFYIVSRNSRFIDHKILWGKIFPLSMIGFPAGVFVFHVVRGDFFKIVFGAFVAILSFIELVVLFREKENSVRDINPLSPLQKMFFFIGGGVMQGAYAAGGPMIVYAASREIFDKGIFRSTLSALWLVMNLFLMTSYIFSGKYTAENLKMTGMLFPSLLAGIAFGDWLHHRIPERVFRVFVYAALFGAGLSLVIHV